MIFHSPWNHQKNYGFLIISGGTDVNLFAQIHLILWAKFGDESLPFSARDSTESIFVLVVNLKCFEKQIFCISWEIQEKQALKCFENILLV